MFESDPVKNFRSQSPHSRDTEMQAFTDMKLKGGETRAKPVLEESKDPKQRIF